jgi:hypothetical protein
VEGVVDHHILGLHHVKENAANPVLWDLGFLAFGAVLVLVGLALSRRGVESFAKAGDVRRAALTRQTHVLQPAVLMPRACRGSMGPWRACGRLDGAGYVHAGPAVPGPMTTRPGTPFVGV